MTVNAEGELTVAWGWVLVGTALSQVIGAPIAAGRRHHVSFPANQLCAGMTAESCYCHVDIGTSLHKAAHVRLPAVFMRLAFLGLDAGLLEMEGVGHLHGWQWLFLVEGLMTVVMGVYLAMALASNPSKVLISFFSMPVCLGMRPSLFAVWHYLARH